MKSFIFTSKKQNIFVCPPMTCKFNRKKKLYTFFRENIQEWYWFGSSLNYYKTYMDFRVDEPDQYHAMFISLFWDLSVDKKCFWWYWKVVITPFYRHNYELHSSMWLIHYNQSRKGRFPSYIKLFFFYKTRLVRI